MATTRPQNTPAKAMLVSLAAVAAILAGPSTAAAEPGPLDIYGLGTFGDAAGQLASPGGVAVDGAGNVYVADSFNHRISVFDVGHVFVRAFGFDVIPGGGAGLEVCTLSTSCKAGVSGGGAGQLASPSDVATDASGNLYVAESNNSRISVFNAQGTFLRAFGANVDPGGGTGFEICTTSCQAGTSFSGESGGLADPSAVASDGSGSLYVGDAGNARISVFTPEGNFRHAFGYDVDPAGGAGLEVCTASCKAGVGGGAAGQLKGTLGIGTDASGNVYVAESLNNRISVFTGDGVFVRAFGFDVDPAGGAGHEVCTSSTGCKNGIAAGGAGALASPADVVTDATGTVRVLDTQNARISEFSADGAFRRAFGWDVAPGGSTTFEICQAVCKPGQGGADPAGQLGAPTGIALDCRGAIYVSEAGNNRVQRIGEPGVGVPPCRASNQFTIGKAKRNRKKGTAKLPIMVPGAGAIALAGKKVKSVGSIAAAATTIQLTVKSRGKAKRRLAKSGRLRVQLNVTYAPDGGDSAGQAATLKLKKSKKRKRAR
jgi:sugar lactone lactonase YvrE